MMNKNIIFYNKYILKLYVYFYIIEILNYKVIKMTDIFRIYIYYKIFKITIF